MVEVTLELQILVGALTLLFGILTSIGVGLKIVGPKIAIWSVDRLDKQLEDPESKHSKTFDKVVKRAQPQLPDFKALIAAELEPWKQKFEVLDSMLQRLESRIPSSDMVAGAVRDKLPASPDFAALELRMMDRIDKIKTELVQTMPDPVDVDDVVTKVVSQIQAPTRDEIAAMINNAWAGAGKQIQGQVDELKSMLQRGAAAAFGQMGADEAKAKAMEAKLERLYKVAGIAEDEEEMQKLLILNKSFDTLAPKAVKFKILKQDEVDDVKESIMSLLEARKEVLEIQTDLSKVRKGPKAGASGSSSGGAGWGLR